MKKRFLVFVAALIVAFTMVFGVTCFASEVEAEEVTETAEEASLAMLLDRVWEFVNENAGDLLSATSLGSVALYIILQKRSNGNFLSGISKVLTSQRTVVAASDDNKAEVKTLSEKQEKMIEYFEKYASSEEERGKIISALLVEVMGLIEIQHVLCLNNSNLPQAMKNLVTSTYARCLSVINDDAAIKDAVDQMRAVLGIGEVIADEETSA